MRLFVLAAAAAGAYALSKLGRASFYGAHAGELGDTRAAELARELSFPSALFAGADVLSGGQIRRFVN